MGLAMGFFFNPNKRITMKKEYITAEELKKILKLSIKIGVELGLYLSYTGFYVEIDQYANSDRKKVKVYYFEPSQLHYIFTHVTAYARLHKRRMSLC